MCASWRMFSQCKTNVAGVHNYEGNCIMVWLTMLRLSRQMQKTCFPVDIQWTNIQATAYLNFTVDLTKLHQDPECALAVYDNTISCFRMYLVNDRKIHMSLYPSGSVVITGAPSVKIAEECLNRWMPIIRKYKIKDVDPVQRKAEQVKKARTVNPAQRKRKRALLVDFVG